MTAGHRLPAVALRPRKNSGTHACFLLFLAWLAAIALPLSYTQTASEYQIKAAYLYNFAKATQWPAQAFPHPDSILVIGVFGGDEEFVRVLRTMISAKTVNGHPLKIIHPALPGDLKACHVVFFRAYHPGNSSAIADLAGASVLMVGEDPNFLEQGGMLNLVLRNGRITFEINPTALEGSDIRYAQNGPAPEKSVEGSIIDHSGSRPVISRTSPDYPDIAKRMGLQGTVHLQAIVRPDGTVRDVRILGGHPMLAAAAEQTVRKWRYQPAARETIETVKITFGE